MFATREQVDTALHAGNHALAFHMQRPIVIVDDSVDDRMLLSFFLRSFLPDEKPIITLRGGDELLKRLAETETQNNDFYDFAFQVPDMIFLDLMMPEMNGVDTLCALRRQSLWDDAPVTLVTCSHDDQAIRDAEDAGANAFMPKPFTKMDVVRALYRENNFSLIM